MGFIFTKGDLGSPGDVGLDSVFLESKSFSLVGLKACLDLD